MNEKEEILEAKYKYIMEVERYTNNDCMSNYIECLEPLHEIWYNIVAGSEPFAYIIDNSFENLMNAYDNLKKEGF